jgi:hypothetical protein
MGEPVEDQKASAVAPSFITTPAASSTQAARIPAVAPVRCSFFVPGIGRAVDLVLLPWRGRDSRLSAYLKKKLVLLCDTARVSKFVRTIEFLLLPRLT